MAIRARNSTARPNRTNRIGAPHQPKRLPPGIASVLSVLSSSAVVVDSNDRVLRASAAARAFGLVKGDRVVVTMRNFPEWSLVLWAVTLLGGQHLVLA